jgi:beta-lactamase class D
MELSWKTLCEGELWCVADKTGKIVAKVGKVAGWYVTWIDKVEHNEYLTKEQAQVYIEDYLGMKRS